MNFDKSGKFYRRIDDLGRVAIPKEFRRAMRVQYGDLFEISCDNNSIILKKAIDSNCSDSLLDLLKSNGDLNDINSSNKRNY